MSTRTDEIGGEPRTVDEARSAVERSRERISSTLDRLEDRIVEKKHELQDRADVLRPVKEQVVERPFTAVAVALGVGALLGSLGGGSGERSSGSSSGRPSSGRPGSDMDDDERRELREWRRARRERLRSMSRHSARDDGDSRLDGLKDQLMGAVTAAIGTAITARVKQMAMGGSTAGDGRGPRD